MLLDSINMVQIDSSKSIYYEHLFSRWVSKDWRLSYLIAIRVQDLVFVKFYLEKKVPALASHIENFLNWVVCEAMNLVCVPVVGAELLQ